MPGGLRDMEGRRPKSGVQTWDGKDDAVSG
jgi:hypothetical protein